MEIKNQNYKSINPDSYYYLPRSQTENIINELSLAQNSKNLEPQDNIKKSKYRRLLENENTIKVKTDKNNENIIQNFDSNAYYNYENDNNIKSLTAVKENQTKNIFYRNLHNRANEMVIKKINFNNTSNNESNLMEHLNFEKINNDYLNNTFSNNFNNIQPEVKYAQKNKNKIVKEDVSVIDEKKEDLNNINNTNDIFFENFDEEKNNKLNFTNVLIPINKKNKSNNTNVNVKKKLINNKKNEVLYNNFKAKSVIHESNEIRNINIDTVKIDLFDYLFELNYIF